MALPPLLVGESDVAEPEATNNLKMRMSLYTVVLYKEHVGKWLMYFVYKEWHLVMITLSLVVRIKHKYFWVERFCFVRDPCYDILSSL